MKHEALTRWTAEESAELYGIRNWGLGYFDIAPSGEVLVKPHGPKSKTAVSLMSLIAGLEDRNLSMPVLLRFSDILSSQIESLNESFRKVIRAARYRGAYRGVYPVKVNQQHEIVADVVEYGRVYHHGLEAGSKTELIAAITALRDPEALLVCNGYKDAEFIDLALHASNMGLRTVLVLEMPSELPLIIERARRMKIRPRLGVRCKLSSRGGGHWDSSGGDRSKFGMNAQQITTLVDELRHAKMLDCLQMLHYHLGSQISDIRRVRTALSEAARVYVELVNEGAAMGVINVGGGLAVDYDGSHTNFPSSRNYTTEEYAADVVEVIMNMADQAGIPHPMIVSESGRSTVAYHSVLIFNVLHVRRFEPQTLPETLPRDSNEMVLNLLDACNNLMSRNAQETYHDALYYRDELRTQFTHGSASLRERALGEAIFWRIMGRIAGSIRDNKYVPDEMEGIDAAIADVYYGNFSVFQSLPDAWAIDQLFPVMPIHRLNEMPSRQSVIADITCDSDGKIDTFIDLHDVKHTIPLHELNGGEYYLGAFLMGAYQETIGDMHNLLGDTNVLHLRISDDGHVEYVKEITGDTVEEVLSRVEYNARDMVQSVRDMAESAVKKRRISAREKGAIITAFEEGMRGYTYFEK